jgi:hypothetical protein
MKQLSFPSLLTTFLLTGLLGTLAPQLALAQTDLSKTRTCKRSEISL